jgi:hypothetical protein
METFNGSQGGAPVPPVSSGQYVPGFVRFIAMIMIVFGAIYLLLSVLGLLAAIASFARGGNAQGVMVLVVTTVAAAIGGGLFASGVGLRRMRKWAFYLYTITVAVGLVMNIVSMIRENQVPVAGIIFLVIQVLILAYFYSIRKQFN